MNQSISEQIKKEAEAYAEKTNTGTGYKELHVEDLKEMSRTDFEAGASFRESLAGKEGMRWVKCSERLPEKEAKVFIKVDGARNMIGKWMPEQSAFMVLEETDINEFKFVRYPPTLFFIQWLDESPMKSEGAEERGVMLFSDFIGKHCDWVVNKHDKFGWETDIPEWNGLYTTEELYDIFANYLQQTLPPAPLTEK